MEITEKQYKQGRLLYIFEAAFEYLISILVAGSYLATLTETLGFSDMNVVQNNGELAGQTVNHFHIHLIPRDKGDSPAVAWKPGDVTEAELMEIRHLLTETKIQ